MGVNWDGVEVGWSEWRCYKSVRAAIQGMCDIKKSEPGCRHGRRWKILDQTTRNISLYG